MKTCGQYVEGLVRTRSDNVCCDCNIMQNYIAEVAGLGTPKPATSGWAVPPEVFPVTVTGTTMFTLQGDAKFVTDVLVLKADTFTYLQDSDYSVSGTTLIIHSPELVAGDRVKITYAI